MPMPVCTCVHACLYLYIREWACWYTFVLICLCVCALGLKGTISLVPFIFSLDTIVIMCLAHMFGMRTFHLYNNSQSFPLVH